MYGILEKLRAYKVKRRYKGHYDPPPLQGLIIFVTLLVTFVGLVLLANC